VTSEAFVDTQPSQEGGDAQGDRQPGRRRNRRGGRGGRDRDEARDVGAGGQSGTEAPSEEAIAAIDAGGLAPLDGELAAPVARFADGESGAADEAQRPEGEGRRRSRGGRNRRDRTGEERPAAESAATDAMERPDQGFGAEREAHPQGELRYQSELVAQPERQAPVDVSPLAPPSDVMASGVAPQPVEVAPTETAAPASEPFVLPLGTLEALAEAAGLQWVNSDAEKIRAVQEAMAREPAPIHVPRERKPVPVLDEGPLVLVETRKDLSQVKLPFETARQEAQGQS